MTSASKIALVGGAILGAAFLLNGCVTDSDGTEPIYTGSIGGSSNYAGNGSYAGYDNGGYAGDSYGGSAGTAGTTGGSAGSNPSNGDLADVRFVDLIPDSGAIDICLQDLSGSGEWLGPLGAEYGIPVDQIYYPAITRYISVPTGTWGIRLVDGKASGCDSPLATDQQASFQKDVGYTVVLGGYRDSFAVQNVTDRPAPEATYSGWQAVNALTDQGTVDFGLLDDSNQYTELYAGIAPFTTGGSVDYDPSTTRPGFILSSDKKTLVAIGPNLNAEAGQVHAVFLHGVNYSDTTAPATTIICQNAVSLEDRAALGVYADKVNHKLLDDSSCVYYQPDGSIGN